MQNPDRFTQGRHPVVAAFILARHIRRWLLPALILTLALGFNFTTQTLVVQGQDGGTGSGQQAVVTYELNVDTTEVNLDRVCLGRTLYLPVTVRRRVLVAGDPDAASDRVRGVNLVASSDNSAVVTADIDRGLPTASADEPFQSLVMLRTVTAGRASVLIRAFLDTEQFDITLNRTLSVRVVPCILELRMSSVWTTRMRSANVVIINSIPGAVITFQEFDPRPPRVNASMRWDTTANRIRGCRGVTHESIPDFADTVVQLEDNNLHVDIEFNPQAADVLFASCDRSGDTRARGCGDLPDGTCYPEISPNDFWRIERLTVDLPLSGGSTTVQLPLTHAGGTATGSATITIIPIPMQSQ